MGVRLVVGVKMAVGCKVAVGCIVNVGVGVQADCVCAIAVWTACSDGEQATINIVARQTIIVTLFLFILFHFPE